MLVTTYRGLLPRERFDALRCPALIHPSTASGDFFSRRAISGGVIVSRTSALCVAAKTSVAAASGLPVKARYRL